ncbi:hypothetical protein DSO57_1007095 [Entomophthora muscae]|uniref:Uncharacterized protein n=1 Tax=Entomophthora muscae TaxID=34485 RepID=A0ACC2TUS8_9FUNG|nr:hypothetical protein DSO57_1007095 [Entomophthora muscae]
MVLTTGAASPWLLRSPAPSLVLLLSSLKYLNHPKFLVLCLRKTSPILSGLTILLPSKPGSKNGIQTLTLNSCGPLGLGTEGLPARVFLGSNPSKLRPRMMAQRVKQAKPKESLHQMEE